MLAFLTVTAFAGDPTLPGAERGEDLLDPRGRAPTLIDPRGVRPDAIIGGDKVTDLSWPDVAGITFRGRYDVGCTGTLIAPNLVLTAGHCAEGITGVVLAAPDYARDDGEYIRVKKVIEYPRSQSTYDVSLLILAEDSTIEPRPIASGCIVDDYLVDDAEVVIAGYGALDKWGNNYSSSMYEATTTIHDADCSDNIDRGCHASVAPGGELGAGGDGVDTCYGDSGGPLFLPTPYGTFLAGVTSRAYWDVDYPCGQGGIYVRADAVLDWIEEESGETLPRAQCNAAPNPSAADLVVWKNGRAAVAVDGGDPDGDPVTFELSSPPLHGNAVVADDGVVTYDAVGGYVGVDTIGVRVTDDKGASGDVSIDVDVLTRADYKATTGAAAPCGCAPGSLSGGGAALFAVTLLTVRRRRATA